MFNVPVLIIQILNFLILLVVLDMVLYKPMVGAIRERETRVKKSLDEAEAIHAEALTLKQDYESRLREARQEASAIVQQATQEAERVRAQIISEANQEKQHIIDKGHQEVQRERQDALSGIRERVVTLSVDMAGQLFRDTLGPEEHRALVDQFVRKAGRLHAG